ncbi:MAG TPA: class I SAM-dependent methyltransferase [Acetobacteraceae bacterium]|nr:class I SAM-dependent methyltransferase [Acetobacteraceae bacterium]
MLERRDDPRFATIAQPSEHAIALLREVLASNPAPSVAEIGVGIGATSAVLCELLAGRGEIAFYDYAEKLEELGADLAARGFTNIRLHGNTRCTFDSYAWTLANQALAMRQAGQEGLFDFIYFDGAHLFHHDAPAAIVCKEMLRPGGVILFDDYDWSIAISPTMRPEVQPAVTKHFTPEQIAAPHVRLICDLFLDPDPAFRKLDIGYHTHEHRRAYRREAR